MTAPTKESQQDIKPTHIYKLMQGLSAIYEQSEPDFEGDGMNRPAIIEATPIHARNLKAAEEQGLIHLPHSKPVVWANMSVPPTEAMAMAILVRTKEMGITERIKAQKANPTSVCAPAAVEPEAVEDPTLKLILIELQKITSNLIIEKVEEVEPTPIRPSQRKPRIIK